MPVCPSFDSLSQLCFSDTFHIWAAIRASIVVACEFRRMRRRCEKHGTPLIWQILDPSRVRTTHSQLVIGLKCEPEVSANSSSNSSCVRKIQLRVPAVVKLIKYVLFHKADYILNCALDTLIPRISATTFNGVVEV
ncbi:hypothetical protein KIN20_032491 [Parelaphostrongylus tenuis]|uniref:Uncharacterized protein n=1 Tax=Parelaphostrongylus tenuis TaxID=148309 RepID=A0AAD5WI26_PARTN|nr:hypothetical protein KIN20_032491 [Parelaphostrongylus tenuis]